nr:hypothetical protein [Nocardioides alcanivorans]
MLPRAALPAELVGGGLADSEVEGAGGEGTTGDRGAVGPGGQRAHLGDAEQQAEAEHRPDPTAGAPFRG